MTQRDNYGYADMLLSLGDDFLSAQNHGFAPIGDEAWPTAFFPLHENHVKQFDERVTQPDLAAAKTWVEGKRERAKHLLKLIHADSDMCH